MCPQHKTGKELVPHSCSQECMPPQTHRQKKGPMPWSLSYPGNNRHPHRNWTALSSRRVLDPNTNPSMKTNESKGQQPNDANVKGNPVCRPLGEAWPCIWNKGSPVTSSSRLIDSLASGFGHFSKPQVHPRAAKTTRKLRDTVYEREEQLPFFRPAF